MLPDSPRLSNRAIAGTCAILIVIPAIVDASKLYVNLTSLYFIPLILCARSFSRRTVYLMAALLVTLTYGIYFFKISRQQPVVHASIWYRLINRTMVAVSLCITAGLLGAWAGVRRGQERRGDVEEADIETPIDRAVRSLRRIIVLMLCFMLIVCIFATDLMTPKQFNLPILYALPLIVAAWAESRRVLWTLLPILVACTWIGFAVSPAATVQTTLPHQTLLDYLLTNRLLACLAQVGIALMLHLWLGPEKTRREKSVETLPVAPAASFDA
jgi:hypothetical protein